MKYCQKLCTLTLKVGSWELHATWPYQGYICVKLFQKLFIYSKVLKKKCRHMDQRTHAVKNWQTDGQFDYHKLPKNNGARAGGKQKIWKKKWHWWQIKNCVLSEGGPWIFRLLCEKAFDPRRHLNTIWLECTLTVNMCRMQYPAPYLEDQCNTGTLYKLPVIGYAVVHVPLITLWYKKGFWNLNVPHNKIICRKKYPLLYFLNELCTNFNNVMAVVCVLLIGISSFFVCPSFPKATF